MGCDKFLECKSKTNQRPNNNREKKKTKNQKNQYGSNCPCFQMRAARGLQGSAIKVQHNCLTVCLNLNTLGPCSTLLLAADCGYVRVGGAPAVPAAGLYSRLVWGSTDPADISTSHCIWEHLSLWSPRRTAELDRLVVPARA